MLGNDTIERALTCRWSQAWFDRREIGDANLAEDAVLLAYNLIEHAEKRTLSD